MQSIRVSKIVPMSSQTAQRASVLLWWKRLPGQGAKVVILDIMSSEATERCKRLAAENVPQTPIFYECDIADVEGAI